MQEKGLLSELEFFDSKAEREALAPLEIASCHQRGSYELVHVGQAKLWKKKKEKEEQLFAWSLVFSAFLKGDVKNLLLKTNGSNEIA